MPQARAAYATQYARTVPVLPPTGPEPFMFCKAHCHTPQESDTALRVVAPATSDVRGMRPPIARVQSATLAGRTSHPL